MLIKTLLRSLGVSKAAPIGLNNRQKKTHTLKDVLSSLPEKSGQISTDLGKGFESLSPDYSFPLTEKKHPYQLEVRGEKKPDGVKVIVEIRKLDNKVHPVTFNSDERVLNATTIKLKDKNSPNKEQELPFTIKTSIFGAKREKVKPRPFNRGEIVFTIPDRKNNDFDLEFEVADLTVSCNSGSYLVGNASTLEHFTNV